MTPKQIADGYKAISEKYADMAFEAAESAKAAAESIGKGHILIFAGRNYYPSGGWNDLFARAHTLEEAHNKASMAMNKLYNNNWVHIVNALTGETLFTSSLGD